MQSQLNKQDTLSRNGAFSRSVHPPRAQQGSTWSTTGPGIGYRNDALPIHHPYGTDLMPGYQLNYSMAGPWEAPAPQPPSYSGHTMVDPATLSLDMILQPTNLMVKHPSRLSYPGHTLRRTPKGPFLCGYWPPLKQWRTRAGFTSVITRARGGFGTSFPEYYLVTPNEAALRRINPNDPERSARRASESLNWAASFNLRKLEVI
ncbi:hypothetical protein V8E52_005779 [Russula decolorans]